MLFSNNNKNAETVTIKTPEKINQATVRELIDMDNGMSVDDHFAKALGDTWYKLNQKDTPDIKTNNSPTEKQSVVSL